MEGRILYKNGDIFSPNRTGHECVVCHQVNCQGVMGAGLAAQIRRMFPGVYDDYRKECGKAAKSSDLLGKVLFFSVKYNGFDYNISSIFGQDRYGRNGCFTDYDALRKAMEPIRVMATPFPAYPLTTVRIPYKMGCGLGGGDWSIVLSIIQEELVNHGIPVEIWRL